MESPSRMADRMLKNQKPCKKSHGAAVGANQAAGRGFYSFVGLSEDLAAQWKRKPTLREYQTLVNTIVWNIWQMDGMTGTIPYCKAQEGYQQMSLFEWTAGEEDQVRADKQASCRIYDWRGKRSLEYREVNTGGRNMKFDFIIGNPPYQEETEGTSDKPIYNFFMDEVFKLGILEKATHRLF